MKAVLSFPSDKKCQEWRLSLALFQTAILSLLGFHFLITLLSCLLLTHLGFVLCWSPFSTLPERKLHVDGNHVFFFFNTMVSPESWIVSYTYQMLSQCLLCGRACTSGKYLSLSNRGAAYVCTGVHCIIVMHFSSLSMWLAPPGVVQCQTCASVSQ